MQTMQVCARARRARTCDNTRSDELGTTHTSGDELSECADFTTVSTASGGSVAVRMSMVLDGVMMIRPDDDALWMMVYSNFAAATGE